MLNQSTKAILIVSFGTSYEDTRKVTIEAIEHDIEQACPNYPIYRAWTSKMIMAKILKRDGIKVLNVKEAMKQMAADGITDVIVQPTHILNGIENDLMKEDALSYQNSFSSITFGNPLLTTEADNDAVIQALLTEFSDLKPDEALVLMGHGTTHFSNSIYAGINYQLQDQGHSNIFLGTVEAYPAMESMLRSVNQYQPRKVILTPFMIVAGDHAKNDMASDKEDSWRSQFENAGYDVSCILKGLGEYPAIRKLLIKHVQEADKLSETKKTVCNS